MAVTVTTGSRTFIAVNQSAHTVEYKGYGSWNDNKIPENLFLRIRSYVGGGTYDTTFNGQSTATSGSYDSQDNGGQLDVPADESSCSWRAFCTGNSTYNGSLKYFKSYAVTATASEPSSANVDHNSAEISCAFYPNTNDSTATAQLQYKTTVGGTWTDFGSSAESDGYTEDTTSIASVSLTGLSASTSYDVRLYISRDTENETDLYSATHTFETTAGTPSVTTDAATGVGVTSATINATVDHNEKDGDLSWRYDTSDPGTADDTSGTEVDYASNPIIADGSGDYSLSSLTANTKYYFWAIYEPDVGDKVYGSILNFTTQVDPGAQAAEQEMLPIITFDRKWGVATTIFFVVPQDAGSSSDLIYDGAAVWGAGETKITGVVYDDDSTPTITAEANATSNPARVASTPIYRLDLSAAEMQHDELYITLTNAGTSVRDITMIVRTHQMLGTVDVDASSKATNTTAVTYTGNGTGAGLKCVAGDSDGKDIDADLNNHTLNYGTLAAYNSSTSVDLDNSTAVATNDYYNGAIILFTGGTGVGQARTITDYDGASYAATLNKALAAAGSTDTTYIIIPGPDSWAITPGSELSALPTAASNFSDMLQFLFQRFAYQREQTATAFTMRKVDAATEFASNAVDDDGSTQTHDALS